MPDSPHQIFPATVFYDGECPVCSREVGVYRRRCPVGKLKFIDIAASDFDADAHGLDACEVNRVMHVKLANGEIRRGVEGFRVIWRATPGMGWAARLAGWPVINQLMKLGYRVFAANRHLLKPRAKR